jgi:hypothetical protein
LNLYAGGKAVSKYLKEKILIVGINSEIFSIEAEIQACNSVYKNHYNNILVGEYSSVS